MIKAIMRSRYSLLVLGRLGMWKSRPYKDLPHWYVEEMAQLDLDKDRRVDMLGLLAREELQLRVHVSSPAVKVPGGASSG